MQLQKNSKKFLFQFSLGGENNLSYSLILQRMTKNACR